MLAFILICVVLFFSYRAFKLYLTRASCNDGSCYGGYKHWVRWALFVLVGHVLFPAGGESIESLLYIATCTVIELSILIPRRFKLFYFAKSYK